MFLKHNKYFNDKLKFTDKDWDSLTRAVQSIHFDNDYIGKMDRDGFIVEWLIRNDKFKVLKELNNEKEELEVNKKKQSCNQKTS